MRLSAGTSSSFRGSGGSRGARIPLRVPSFWSGDSKVGKFVEGEVPKLNESIWVFLRVKCGVCDGFATAEGGARMWEPCVWSTTLLNGLGVVSVSPRPCFQARSFVAERALLGVAGGNSGFVGVRDGLT